VILETDGHGLILNYHLLAPRRYKRSVVSGFVHRIFRACSTWSHFHESMQRAKVMLERNQYPPTFYDPVINQTLNGIRAATNQQEDRSDINASSDTTSPPNVVSAIPHQEEAPKRAIFIQYRGKCTEDFARSLHKCQAPCSIIMTLRKLKTTLPSLKQPIEKFLRSGVVYEITCARCNAAYVGQTARHLRTRFWEHQKKTAPVRKHMDRCECNCTMEHVNILASSSRGEQHLKTLEALFIEERNPTMNTQEDFRNRSLTIKWF